LYHESRDAFTKDQLRLLQSIAPKLSLSIEVAARAAALSEMNELDLPGAAATIHHLDAELTRCRRLNSPLAIILCSVAGMSQLQINSGRAEAEGVARGLALAMQDGLREYDYLGRLGPAEYLLVLPGLSTFAVRAKVAKLMQISTYTQLNRLWVLAAEAVSGDDGNEADELLTSADRRIHELRSNRLAVAAKADAQAALAGASWVQ
jgi:GGDEF domain-containing protein